MDYPILDFAFIVVVPFVIVGATLAGLFATGALFDVLDHPEETKGIIEGLFRHPPAPPRPLAADHYYRPHWSEGEGDLNRPVDGAGAARGAR